MIRHVERIALIVVSLVIGTVALLGSPSAYAADVNEREGISQEEKENDFKAQNDIIYFGNSLCAGGDSSSTTVKLAGNNNVEKVLNYLQEHGLTLEQAAGVVGNFQWESGSPELDPKGSDGKAVGIGQWQDSRLDNLKKYAGDNYQDADTQILYLGVELGFEPPKNGAIGGSEKGALDAIKTARSPEEAAVIWNQKFERSGDANSPGSLAYTTRQTNARKVFNQYSGGATGETTQDLSADTGSSSSGSSSCGGSGATGAVNADGYAFPIALSKDEVSNGSSWPCPGICHHDGTPAFDLSKKAQDDSTEGTPVIAIYKGTIQRLNNAYSGINGCQAFQLVGDDGWWYWYGHLKGASVQDGAKVTAGQQIASVGQRACTGNGSYPHLHIDRGSPQGHYGGSVCCRDPGMVPLINKLHDELGGTASVL